MARSHRFGLEVVWTGDRGDGTTGPRDYDRTVEVSASRHPLIAGSAARAFHGDADRWNPEELLLAALAQCHLLSYLREAALAGVHVVAYRDTPELVLALDGESGQVIEAVLRPEVEVVLGDLALAETLHDTAAAKCFIARSINFPVRHDAVTRRVPAVDVPLSPLA